MCFSICFSTLYMRASVMRLYLAVYVRVYYVVSMYWLCPVWFVTSRRTTTIYMYTCYSYIHISRIRTSGVSRFTADCRNMAVWLRFRYTIIKGLRANQITFLTHKIILQRNLKWWLFHIMQKWLSLLLNYYLTS